MPEGASAMATIAVAMTMLVTAFAAESVYKNYTVGDSKGWTLGVDYTAWAANKTFSLGDTLEFTNVDNHTVVQTTLLDAYKSCNSSLDENLQVWYGVSSNESVVVLSTEGINYIFSDAGDGEDCKDGMKFSINVTHGYGLPPSPPPSPAPTQSSSQSPPINQAGTSSSSKGQRVFPASFFPALLCTLLCLSYTQFFL